MKITWSLVARWATVLSLTGYGHGVPTNDKESSEGFEKLRLLNSAGPMRTETRLPITEVRPHHVWVFTYDDLDLSKDTAGLYAPGQPKFISHDLPLTDAQKKLRSSLYDLAHDKADDVTLYIRAYSDPRTAWLAGFEIRPTGTYGGLLCKISAYRSIDIEGTLSEKIWDPVSKRWDITAEGEHAFMSFVPSRDIEGVYKVGDLQDSHWAQLAKGETLPSFVRNAKWDATKLGEGGLGMQPALADFPSNHPNWQLKEWREWKGKDIDLSYKGLRSEALGVDSQRRFLFDLRSPTPEGLRAVEFKEPGKSILKGPNGQQPGARKKSVVFNPEDEVKLFCPPPKWTYKRDLHSDCVERYKKGMFKDHELPAQSFDDELSVARKQAAKAKFVELTSNHGISHVGSGSKRLSMPDLFDRLSPRFKLSLKNGAIGTAVELPSFLWNLHTTYSQVDSTSMERTAALTSIVPAVGCLTQHLASIESSVPDAGDAMMCIVADALLFTPLMPVGILMHLSRSFFASEYRFKSPEDAQRARDQGWSKYFDTYVARLGSTAAAQWDADLTAALAPVAWNQALIDEAKKNATLSEEGRKEADVIIQEAQANLTRASCERVANLYAKLRVELPINMTLYLETQARQFNQSFISEIQNTMSTPLLVNDALAAAAEIPKIVETVQGDGPTGRRRRASDYDKLDPNLRRQQYAKDMQPRINEIIKPLEESSLPILTRDEISRRIESTLAHRWHRDPCQPDEQLRKEALKEDEEERQRKHEQELKTLACTGEAKFSGRC